MGLHDLRCTQKSATDLDLRERGVDVWSKSVRTHSVERRPKLSCVNDNEKRGEDQGEDGRCKRTL